ncbi:hypothetical protein ACQBAT_09730 [Ornithinimicrobium sp. Y1847]|uniref:hypothetical protein n=1 Tax=unclassified Ornithinimicrobium TaxID=2615080 RepID=UPI003B67AF2E
MTSAFSEVVLAAEGGHPVVNELPFAPIWFGVIALTALMGLLAVLWAFRNTLALDPHGIAEGEGHHPQAGRDSTH